VQVVLAVGRYENWVRDNAPFLAAAVCALLGLLVFRLVVRTVTRMLLLAILLMVTIFIAAERDEIQQCAQTCKCELAGVETSVAFCEPNLD
jgi:hypothetical protein